MHIYRRIWCKILAYHKLNISKYCYCFIVQNKAKKESCLQLDLVIFPLFLCAVSGLIFDAFNRNLLLFSLNRDGYDQTR